MLRLCNDRATSSSRFAPRFPEFPDEPYFLGAGACADAGVPLTGALLGRVRQRLRSASEKDRRSLMRFIEAFGFEDRGVGTRPAVVDVISFLDSRIRNEQPLDSFFTIERLRMVRKQLALELSHVIEGSGTRGARVRMPKEALDQPGARGPRIASYFKTFARNLRPGSRQPGAPLGLGDAIITTNLDTNIDVALYELAYWDESVGDVDYSNIYDVFLGSQFRDPYDDTDALSHPDATVDLLKLHGSMNWLYCPRCTRIYVAAFGFSVRLLIGPKKWEVTCHCGYHPLEQVLIAPSAFQEIVNPHLQAIWMNAYHVLENADKWVFVRYSLPAEDLAVRALLHRALSGRKWRTGRAPLIEVVCPAKYLDVLKPRYVGLLGSRLPLR